MQNLVQNVTTHVVFHFANGATYELPLKKNSNEHLQTYGSQIRLREGLYSRSSSNIVGNIVGNSFSIEAVSWDKLLLPNNTSSPYYGYMNDTAYVDITCDVVDDQSYQVYMGRYYVDTWEGGSTADKSNEVSISCVDLLSKIKNIALGKIRLKRNISFNDYLKIVIDTLNDMLPNYMKILYTEGDLNIWRNSPYTWQMYFNNIERDNIENLFNCIAEYTISYIWINRERHLVTDHLLDDTIGESVGILNGGSNLLNYGTLTGDIDKYSGVKVKYIQSISSEDRELLNLKDVQLYAGENSFIDQVMHSDKVYDIHTIKVDCETGEGIVTYFSNYKNSIDFTIESTRKTKATITIYGSILNETYDVIEEYKDDNKKDTLIEIENRVLIKELIPTYTDGLITLMSMKNNQVYAEGFINPRIKLGDTVQLIGNTMGINDYYKVVGLEYTLGVNYRCKATMIKTIEMPRNVDDILYRHNQLLLTVLSNDEVPAASYPDIDSADNTICETVMSSELEELRSILYGG